MAEIAFLSYHFASKKSNTNRKDPVLWESCRVSAFSLWLQEAYPWRWGRGTWRGWSFHRFWWCTGLRPPPARPSAPGGPERWARSCSDSSPCPPGAQAPRWSCWFWIWTPPPGCSRTRFRCGRPRQRRPSSFPLWCKQETVNFQKVFYIHA